MRLLRRNRWPVAIGLYDARQCPYCGALVIANNGQRIHEGWHDELDREINGEEPYQDPGGFIVPDINNGALPIETRGGRDTENDELAR